MGVLGSALGTTFHPKLSKRVPLVFGIWKAWRQVEWLRAVSSWTANGLSFQQFLSILTTEFWASVPPYILRYCSNLFCSAAASMSKYMSTRMSACKTGTHRQGIGVRWRWCFYNLLPPHMTPGYSALVSVRHGLSKFFSCIKCFVFLLKPELLPILLDLFAFVQADLDLVH